MNSPKNVHKNSPKRGTLVDKNENSPIFPQKFTLYVHETPVFGADYFGYFPENCFNSANFRIKAALILFVFDLGIV